MVVGFRIPCQFERHTQIAVEDTCMYVVHPCRHIGADASVTACKAEVSDNIVIERIPVEIIAQTRRQAPMRCKIIVHQDRHLKRQPIFAVVRRIVITIGIERGSCRKADIDRQASICSSICLGALCQGRLHHHYCRNQENNLLHKLYGIIN